MRSLSVLLCVAWGFCSSVSGADPKELRLWPGKAPGSENWTVPESNNGVVASNVSDPTLAVYLPDAAKSNGAAIIVAPGGALQALAMKSEGADVAEWLNSQGIAAFVLKYRLRQQSAGPAGRGAAKGAGRGAAKGPGGPGVGGREEITITKGNANPNPDDAELTKVLQMAVADAQQALRLIRKNAAEWRVDPNRIGMMGFSAGGGVSVGATIANAPGAKVNFLISVYGPSLQDVIVPDDAPPLFVAVGTNHFNVASGCLALFAEWKKAGKPAEIHVYDQTGGGFGISKRGIPVDTWTDRLMDWMKLHKLLTPQ